MCDEVYCIIGVMLVGDDELNFVWVYDGQYLKVVWWLYMIVMLRIFIESIKDRVDQYFVELVLMDDELMFGLEFYWLLFGEVVECGLFIDYKVMVFIVDQGVIVFWLQQEFFGVFGELMFDDVFKIVGCWNGLVKWFGIGIVVGELLMCWVVVFVKDIKMFKQVVELFLKVVEVYCELVDDGLGLVCLVCYVDGMFNVLVCNEQLVWFKGVVVEDECCILFNVCCFFEGVDVFVLDVVLFLNLCNFIVDVVQLVGWVMCKLFGKDYGYVILLVVVFEGVELFVVLVDNKWFKVVWQVFNVLWLYDECFDVMVNSIVLNVKLMKIGEGSDKLLGGYIGLIFDEVGFVVVEQLVMFLLLQWQEVIYVCIVDKVGIWIYWEQWVVDVVDIVVMLIICIYVLFGGVDVMVVVVFEQFLVGLCDNFNDLIIFDDVISMFLQYLIIKLVFDVLFVGYDFVLYNLVLWVMQKMVDIVGGVGLEVEIVWLEGFYELV